MIATLAATLVALGLMIACDVPAPNPLAAGGTNGQQSQAGASGSSSDGGPGGSSGAQPTAASEGALASAATGEGPAGRAWPTTSCPGGPCATPDVCVNLDFLFVACVPCGGEDEVCCPSSDAACDPGLVCDQNPNFRASPPLDLVERVCQVPGRPPAADGRLNHQGERLKASASGR